MKVGDRHYHTIWLNEDGRSVDIIDQRWLPHDLRVVTLKTVADVALAIRDMWVRGAPLIGVTAAYGVAIAMTKDPSDAHLDAVWDELHQTRPTAINLRWALDAMRDHLRPLPEAGRADAAYQRATEIAEEDIELNRAIGANGLKVIRQIAAKKKRASRFASSPTAMPAGWRPSITAPRRRRSTWRSRKAYRCTSMSTRRGRATRAPISPPGR